MQRSKFPYSARSSAKIIRHAVSIDERRAKFRSDLISGKGTSGDKSAGHHRHHLHHHAKHGNREPEGGKAGKENGSVGRPRDRFRRPSRTVQPQATGKRAPSQPNYADEGNEHLRPRQPSPGSSQRRANSPVSSVCSNTSQLSMPPRRLNGDDDDDDEVAGQDIEELWFPGCHADLGGGWPVSADEELPLSHVPLVWMVREAQRAGLDFDDEMIRKLKCGDDFQGNWSEPDQSGLPDESGIPSVQVTGSTTPDLLSNSRNEKADLGWTPGSEPEVSKQSEFRRSLHDAATKSRVHDCLRFNNGLGAMSVISWKIMEYLPFRRMDLKPDGTWSAISFP